MVTCRVGKKTAYSRTGMSRLLVVWRGLRRDAEVGSANMKMPRARCPGLFEIERLAVAARATKKPRSIQSRAVAHGLARCVIHRWAGSTAGSAAFRGLGARVTVFFVVGDYPPRSLALRRPCAWVPSCGLRIGRCPSKVVFLRRSECWRRARNGPAIWCHDGIALMGACDIGRAAELEPQTVRLMVLPDYEAYCARRTGSDQCVLTRSTLPRGGGTGNPAEPSAVSRSRMDLGNLPDCATSVRWSPV